MNEENVKVKIVLPHLRNLGINDRDLSFEDSFWLKIGTNKVTIGGSASSRSVRARSDIVVKKGQANLFVVEIKAGDQTLDDDDRDQAISYARLLHPIAPFALLTNGTDWLLFDTITRARIDPAAFKLKSGYRVTLPDADREEALAYFLGHSLENLMLFCRAQVAEHLKPLIGSPLDLTKKYIPELTIPRMSMLDVLATFETSEHQAFLVLGESGDGKTSALCDYAQRRLNSQRPTLFFSGLTLEGGLLNAISSEFGWVFSENVTPVQLVRRISEITRGNPLTIIIDAIDEWT